MIMKASQLLQWMRFNLVVQANPSSNELPISVKQKQRIICSEFQIKLTVKHTIDVFSLTGPELHLTRRVKKSNKERFVIIDKSVNWEEKIVQHLTLLSRLMNITE